VSVAERSKFPWRSEGKPWKTVSLVVMQKRCAKILASLAPRFRLALDEITQQHLKRVSKLSKQEWTGSKAVEIEALVAEEVMRLAARVAGMEPCKPSASSYVIGMRGKPGIACNFTHWWVELPTGRKYRSGAPERVRCETYPNAPIYFTPCFEPTGKRIRGTWRIHVKALLASHGSNIAKACAMLTQKHEASEARECSSM
jgi:hypothetical protein